MVPLIAGLHGLGIGSDLRYLGFAAAALMVFAAACFLPRRPSAPATAPLAAE